MQPHPHSTIFKTHEQKSERGSCPDHHSDENSDLQDDQQSKLVPGVKNILLNSLKINKKLHGQIMARQYSIKNETQQINSKLHSIYRDIQEIHNKTQELYEDTVQQNQKTRFLAEQLIKPFRDELNSKIDQSTFSLKLKMVLSQFDGLGQNITYDQNGKAIETSHAFEFMRKEMLPLVHNLQHDVQILKKCQDSQRAEINNIDQKGIEFDAEMIRMRKAIYQIRSQLLGQINKANNEQVWHSRLKNFYNDTVATSINVVSNTVKRMNSQLQSEIKGVRNMVDKLQKQFKKANQNISAKNQKEVMLVTAKCEELNKRVGIEFAIIDDKIEKYKQSIVQSLKGQIIEVNNSHAEQLVKLQMALKQQIEEVTNLQNSQRQLPSSIIQVDEKIVNKIKSIEAEIKNNKNMFKCIEQKIQTQHYQISAMRDVLSKKANFSDLLKLIEGKADKGDYKQLKTLIQNSNQVQKMDRIDKRMTTQEEFDDIASQKLNKKKSLSHRKYLLSPSSHTSVAGDGQRDTSCKKYMLGLRQSKQSKESGFTRQTLLKQKKKFMFLNQTQRRLGKQFKTGEDLPRDTFI